MKKLIIAFAMALPLLAVGAYAAQGSQAGNKDPGKAAVEKPKTAEQRKKGKAEKAVLRKVTREELGKEAFCPVTGEKLTVKEDTGSASYKGRNYYFCCPGCDKSFLANPEKFVNKKPAAEAGKVYVCPMNDYQGDKPGKCPKCGMTLQEKK